LLFGMFADHHMTQQQITIQCAYLLVTQVHLSILPYRPYTHYTHYTCYTHYTPYTHSTHSIHYTHYTPYSPCTHTVNVDVVSGTVLRCARPRRRW
jgi:hypothetical protein